MNPNKILNLSLNNIHSNTNKSKYNLYLYIKHLYFRKHLQTFKVKCKNVFVLLVCLSNS